MVSCAAKPPRNHAPKLPRNQALMPPTPQLTRYWFQIESTNQIQCIWAVSFTEAKLKAAKRFLSHWGKISWLHLSD